MNTHLLASSAAPAEPPLRPDTADTASGSPHRRGRARRVYPVALLCMALLLSGCSLRKIGYNLAARFIVSRIVDTFDLDKAQKRQTQAAVAELHSWHRKNELPRYVQFLDGVISKVSDGLSRDEVLAIMQEAETTVARTGQKLAPEASALLSTLTAEQIDHFEKEMHKGSQERFERLELPEQEYVNFRLKRAKKNLNTWMGSYTDAQLAEFERFIRKNRPEELRRQKVNEQSRVTLLTALRTRAPRPTVEGIIYNWLTKEQATPTEDDKRAEERNRDDFVELVLSIDRSLSPAQRKYLLKELGELRTDLYELASGT